MISPDPHPSDKEVLSNRPGPDDVVGGAVGCVGGIDGCCCGVGVHVGAGVEKSSLSCRKYLEMGRGTEKWKQWTRTVIIWMWVPLTTGR